MRQTDASINFSKKSHRSIVPCLRSPGKQGGFTFIEVTIALALLAMASGVLIGMQSAAVRRTLRDTNAQAAMLAARRIMASIEVSKDSEFAVGTQNTSSVGDLLQQLNISGIGDKVDSSTLNGMTAAVSVDELELQMPFEETQEIMKKITLRVSWGPGVDESLALVYQRSPQ
jgi:prepilin-type N-terminal cleavage/methylation domain-containing protein